MNRKKIQGKKNWFFIVVFLGCQNLVLVASEVPIDQMPVTVELTTTTEELIVSEVSSEEVPTETPVATPEPLPPAPVEIPTEVAQKPTPEEVPAVVSGIDTIDIEEGGNWLLKRKALEDTVNLIEEINMLFTKILQASTDFKINRNKLDNEQDLFMATVGFNLGDFDQLLVMLLDDLDKEQKREGDLSADERATMLSINEKKKELEQLQTDLKALETMDDELDTVVATVDNQIKTANNYQTQAWKNFQIIKKVLDDEKADELYYQTDGLYKSMQEIYSYLTQTLSTYFSEQMQFLRDQMKKIQSGVTALQQKGVDLKTSYDKLQEQEAQEEKRDLEIKMQEEIQKALAQAELSKPISWWQRITNIMVYPWNLLKTFLFWSTDWVGGLFGKKTQEITPVTPISEGEAPVAEET